MFNYPYAQRNTSLGARQMNSYIRFFHASPDAPAVDVYINDSPVIINLSYKEITQYYPIAQGSYNIKLYPTGQTEKPIFNTNLFIPANTIFNVAIIGTLSDLGLYPIPEPLTPQNFGRPCIRFIHLSPNAPAVDIKTSDGTTVFDSVGYKDITDYACIPAGTYSFTLTPTGTTSPVLKLNNIQLAPNNFYTIYAVGQVGKTPGLEVLVVTEPRK